MEGEIQNRKKDVFSSEVRLLQNGEKTLQKELQEEVLSGKVVVQEFFKCRIEV